MRKKQASGREEDGLEALRQSESRLRLILESTSDGINVAEYDPRTHRRRLVMCNDRYVEMSGRSREELMAADDLNRLVAWTTYRGPTFLEQTPKGLPSEGTASWLRPDGKENCYDWTAAPLKVGDKYHIIGIDRDITNRKRAEEALRESESKHRFLLENLPQMIFYKDRNSVYVSCNENFARSVKIRPEEISGKTDHDFFLRELADKYRADDKRIMASGKPEDIEEKFIGVGEEKEIFVHIVKTPIRDAKSDVVGVLGIFWDITEHKRADEALLESEKTARALLDATQDLALMIDPDGTLLAVNEIAAKAFGKAPSELIGKNVRDTFRPDLVEQRLTQSAEVVRSGKPLRFEDEHDGMWLDHSVYPIFDSEGKVARLAIFARDITESRKAEEALRESEKTARALLDATPDAALMIEPNGTILAMNDMAAKGFGKSASKLIGTNVRDTLRPDLAQQRLTRSDKVVRSGKPLRFEDEHDGMWLDHSVYPIFDSEGKVARLAIFARDITESRKAEEALRESEKTARALLNATQDLALMIDPDGTLLAMNEIAAAKEFGKAPSELIGKNVRDTDRSDLVEQRLTQSDEVVRSGKPLRFEDEHDGLLLDHSIYPIFDSEGRVVRLAIFARDITESKKAEEALRNSERNLRKRVRELNCLHQVTEVVNACGDSLDALFQGITDILPESCQYPEKACARIAFGEKEYATENFRESPRKLAADILVAGEKAGVVEVFCLKEKPPADEGPFLEEEKSLIDTVAARIGRNIERIQTRQRLIVEQSALHEKNIALREVMAGIQDEKKEFGRRIVSNVEKIIMPLLYALEQELPQGQRKYVDLLKGGLEDITLPFADRLSKQFASLTPTEIRICNLIRRGLSTKEIAGLQHVSPATVNKHREHIRRKLQIMNKDVNLATYLENYMSGHAGD